MAFVEWENKYSVFQDKLDEDHRMLFDIINELYKAMAIGQGYLITSEILKKLYEYTHTHFQAEEEFMKAANYGGLKVQLEQHKIFLDKIIEFLKDAREGSRTLHINVALFLKDWIINHILKIDNGLKSIRNTQYTSTLK
jgi:hemerythrin-like metal-binding protein